MPSKTKRIAVCAGLIGGLAAVATGPVDAADSGGKVWRRIEIDGPEYRPLPIAVAPLKVLGGGDRGKDVARTVGDVIRSDFEISGLFQVLDPRSFIADPEKEGLHATTINFRAWLDVGAEYLIKGGVKPAGAERFEVELKLFEVASGREVLAEKHEYDADDARDASHRFGDAVVRSFGHPSVFLTRVAAVRGSGDHKEILLMDFDGARPRPVTRNKVLDLFPNWSPDGRSLVYTSFAAGKPDLYVLDLTGGKSQVVSKEPGLNIGGSFSPDGRSVAATLSPDGNPDVYVMAPDGSNRRRVTDTWGIDTSPSWAPDGKRIAFASSRTGNSHIYVMNIDGSDVRRLTYQGTNNTEPEWSPRGDKIVFTARDERRAFDLFVVDVEHGQIERLTQEQGDNKEPSWSPDGRHIAFTSNRDGPWQVYLMSAKGTNQRRITTDRENWSTPSWGPFAAKAR
jgi:TolB protein